MKKNTKKWRKIPKEWPDKAENEAAKSALQKYRDAIKAHPNYKDSKEDWEAVYQSINELIRNGMLQTYLPHPKQSTMTMLLLLHRKKVLEEIRDTTFADEGNCNKN